MSVRESFVQRFGEEQAARIEAAAHEHMNGPNSENKGSDAFRWAIAIVIGYQCAEVARYRESHEITAPWSGIQQWIKEHGDLVNHDGDVCYLTLLAGGYNQYMPTAPESAEVTP